MSTVSQKIRQFRILHNLNQSVLAEQVGISPSYLSHIERGTRDIDTELLTKFSKVFSCNLAEFFIDNTQMSTENKLQLKKSPIVSSIRFSGGEYEILSDTTEYTPFGPIYDNGYWFDVTDSLMEPRYNTGDLVFIQPNIKSQSGDFSIVIKNNIQQFLIRRVYVKQEGFLLTTLQQHIQPEIVARENVLLCSPILYVKVRR